jgi:hypothetical protein
VGQGLSGEASSGGRSRTGGLGCAKHLSPLLLHAAEATLIHLNVVERGFSEVRVRRVLGTSLLEHTDSHQAALKYTMADAPTTTTTKASIKMAGSTTISSALPVVVACISLMPTVAK